MKLLSKLGLAISMLLFGAVISLAMVEPSHASPLVSMGAGLSSAGFMPIVAYAKADEAGANGAKTSDEVKSDVAEPQNEKTSEADAKAQDELAVALTEKNALEQEHDALKGEYAKLEEGFNNLDEKIAELEAELAAKDEQASDEGDPDGIDLSDPLALLEAAWQASNADKYRRNSYVTNICRSWANVAPEARDLQARQDQRTQAREKSRKENEKAA